MNGLDSSFEALAFLPLNLSPLLSAVAHNIWAWIALFTAAFSFWRIYALSLRTTSSHIPLSPPPPPQRKENVKSVFVSKTTSFEGIEEEEEEEREDEGEGEVKEQNKRVVVGVHGLTRGNSSNKFFTVYYEERENFDDDHHFDDDDKEDEEEEDDDEKKNGRRKSVVIKRWGSTGSTVEMRRSSSSSSSSEYDMGWYSYQDRKVINGSVVRLWEDQERENNGCVSPRNCRRSCLVGLTSLG